MFLRRNVSSFFAILISVILLLVVLSISARGVKSIRLKSETVVRTCKAQSGNIQDQIDVRVLIKSQKYKEYYGNQLRVKKISVKVGDYVEKGAELIQFDNSEILTQYTQAKIQLENAILQKNQMVINKENFKKQKEEIGEEILRLRESQEDNESFILELEDSFEDNKGFLSKSKTSYADEIEKLEREGEDIKNRVQDLERQRDAIPDILDDQIKLLDNSIILCENNLKNAEERINTFKDITADFNGVVTDINITEGSYSSPGSVILVIQDPKNLKGVCFIPQQNISKVKLGQQVLINDPIGAYNGKISSISNLAFNACRYDGYSLDDSRDNSLVAEIEILNPNDKLKIDFDLDGKICLEESTDILKIPIECILYDDNNNPYVFTVQNNVVSKQNIETGRVLNNYIEVISGVKLSDSIVISPPKSISDKGKVKVAGSKS